MENEIEKLYAEAIPHKRGKMSIKLLDLTFRKIGITLAVQHIRSLLFQYDKTKTKDLDLNEFRELIQDIIASCENPNKIPSLPEPVSCTGSVEDYSAPAGYRIAKRHTDVITVYTNHQKVNVDDGANALNQGSLWTSNDASVVSGVASCKHTDALAAANIRRSNLREITRFRHEEAKRLLDEQRKSKDADVREKLTRTFTLPRKSKNKKKEQEKASLKNSSSLDDLNVIISYNDVNKGGHINMYGENDRVCDQGPSQRTPEEDNRPLTSHFNRNMLRRSCDFSTSSSKRKLCGERDRIIHTYTLPRKSSSSKSSRASLRHSVSLSRKWDFLNTLYKTHGASTANIDQENFTLTQYDHKLKVRDVENQGQMEIKKSLTLPRRSKRDSEKEKRYSLTSMESNVCSSTSETCDVFLDELRTKLTKQE